MNYLIAGRSLQNVDKVPEWAKRVYVTAPDISPEDHVLMQATFQKHVDSGISKTINLDTDATNEDVKNAYILAWTTGCKGITVYRAGSRDKEVLVKGTQTQVQIEDCCDQPNIIYESVYILSIQL